MDFERMLKKAEKAAVKTASHVGKKGEELLNAGKTKLEVKKQELALDDLYCAIGKKVAAKYEETGEALCSCFIDELEQITEIKAQIAAIEVEIVEEECCCESEACCCDDENKEA